eukprot:gb/GEZN01011553.1/.p1 GENE.gb/GEZN01011553.1/~~gb/GEZN01011553.1/.p1  ORF type:complete len:301 (-),score=26.61 gb/GEZN01011553.1/:230-1132(-)
MLLWLLSIANLAAGTSSGGGDLGEQHVLQPVAAVDKDAPVVFEAPSHLDSPSAALLDESDPCKAEGYVANAQTGLCECAPGYFGLQVVIDEMKQLSGCTVCPAGTYADTAASEECAACPSGYTCNAGAISYESCHVTWESAVCTYSDSVLSCPTPSHFDPTGPTWKLQPTFFDGLSKATLTSVVLSHSRIGVLADGAFQGLDALLELRLEENEINTLGDQTFQGLNSLELLWLQENRIEQISSNAFQHLDKLKTFNIQNNLISSVGNEFCPVRALLNVSGLNAQKDGIDPTLSSSMSCPV